MSKISVLCISLAFKLQERSSNFCTSLDPALTDSMEVRCKVYLLASPRKSFLQEIMGRVFSLYPDIWNSGGSHWAVAFWFPNGDYVRYEPGVHNGSLRGHLQAGKASTEKGLALPGEHRELVGEVNTTPEAIFQFFTNYRGGQTSKEGGVASEVNADCSSRTLQPTAQRDWVEQFLSNFQDLSRPDIKVPVERLQAHVR